MAKGNKVVDLSAANKLNISITSITPSAAWKRQIRGSYTYMYPYIQGDFLHLEDFDQWNSQYFKTHKHKGNKGYQTSAPLYESILTTEKARSYLENNKVLGYIRKGISTIARLIDDLNRSR